MAKVHRIGFTRLDDGDSKGHAQCSHIVFIHGLRGDPRRTWGGQDSKAPSPADHTSPDRSSLRASLKGLSFRKKSPAPEDAGAGRNGDQASFLFWPQELLPADLPEAKIWTYGYNADVIEGVFGKNSKDNVSQHGRNLVAHANGRELEDGKPIIFVAHSLGGIVVKDAIRRSEDLQERVIAVIFLGTPHHGSHLSDWAQIASNLARFALQDPNKDITAVLQPSSEVLENIHEEFIKIVRKRGIHIHCFREARGMSGMRGLSRKVVEDLSSSLGIPEETVESINADHRQMVRCSGTDDERYRAVLRVLGQFLRHAKTNSSSNTDVASLAPQSAETTAPHTSSVAQPSSSVPHFMVQFPRNKRFVGRGEALSYLQEKLFEDDDSHNVAVVGLGGIGKTQLALQMAYWTRENKPGWSVFWLPALSMAGFEQACASMVRQISPEAASTDDPKGSVLRYLNSAQSGQWLLIVDNADDRDLLLGTHEAKGMFRHLPSNENGRILFTTRYREVAYEVAEDNFLNLAGMSSPEAFDCLKRLGLPPKDEEEPDTAIAALSEALEFLPLALSQAAAYIVRNQVSIAKYLLLLQDKKEEATLLSREYAVPTTYKEKASRNTVMTTWLVSFDKIRETDEPAAMILSFLSQVEWRAIPQAMLPRLKTEGEMLHAIGTLTGFAFLQRRDDGCTFDMHRLVHLATRTWFRQQDDAQQLRRTALRHLQAIFNTSKWEAREAWRQYLPHVLNAIHLAADSTVWGEEECELGYWAASCLRVEGRMADSLKLMQQVVKVQETTLSESDFKRLRSQHSLAVAYNNHGKITEAFRILEKLVRIRETLPESHPDRLASQHELASSYIENKQPEEAIKLLEHVVRMQEALPESDPNRMLSQHELAAAYLDNRQVNDAIQLFEYLLRIQQALPESHPDRLALQHDLARAYLKNGRSKEAVQLLENVTRIQQSIFTESHVDRLASESLLAKAYEVDGQSEKAAEKLQHVAEIRTRVREMT